MSETAPATCINGHAVLPGESFCPMCGVYLQVPRDPTLVMRSDDSGADRVSGAQPASGGLAGPLGAPQGPGWPVYGPAAPPIGGPAPADRPGSRGGYGWPAYGAAPPPPRPGPGMGPVGGPYGRPSGYGVPGPGGGPYGSPPPYGAASYGWQGYRPPDWYAPRTGTNGFAIASLVLGIVWIFWLGSVLAVIFGHVALGEAKRSGEGGTGMAIAGLVLGYLGVASLVATIIGASVSG